MHRTLTPLRLSSRYPAFKYRHLSLTAQAQNGKTDDSFITSSADTAYFDDLYAAFLQDEASVDKSWAAYFKTLKAGPAASPSASVPEKKSSFSQVYMPAPKESELMDHLKVQLLCRAFQVQGHMIAKLNPLELSTEKGETPAELTIEHYGWSAADLTRSFSLGPGILPRFAVNGKSTMTLQEILDQCKKVYSGSIGAQFLHIPSKEECEWIRSRIEIPVQWSYSLEKKESVLDRLLWSDSFERFIASKFPNEKRFGLEGCESLIPGMKALIDRSVEHDAKHIVIGMPHRGRLNVLSNVVRKPGEAIFNEFIGATEKSESGGGDVKYHLGANFERPTPSGKKVALSLVANPSHLEAEDPLVLGKVRGLQEIENDPTSAVGVLLHGDAAFAGQGIVYETMGMVNLPNYSTQGTIHIVVNNQIGFTTNPKFSRSTPYPSDIAKAFDAPVFHANGDDVEAVTFCCELAADFRAKFKKDVVVDIICYRRHGHNETDQPSFTQPKQYEAIAKHDTTLNKYIAQLNTEGSFSSDQTHLHQKKVWDQLEGQFQGAKTYKASDKEWLSSAWEGFPSPKELAENILPVKPTGVAEKTLKSIGEVIGSYPKDFTPHKNLVRILKARTKTVQDGKGIDWSTAEALAFGSLALEKVHVRLSGQDVERGTFSQRHAVLTDQVTEKTHTPLSHVGTQQAKFVVSNSHLSEYGCLGFELGYSLCSPDSLVIWEAQFGDFHNGAQIMIDQFIASGERKWHQRSGIVLNLPHGYDGQGPEHSSGRIERFLQLVDDNPMSYPSPKDLERQHQDCNMQVAYPTTPANYFHLLRRQYHRDFRKPLVLFFSKALLRHPLVKSDIEDFTGETKFQRYIPEPHASNTLDSPDKIRRHILCSGQVYFTALAEREKRGIKDIAISRVEQLAPLPYDLITPHLDTYPNAETIWLQEEPMNNGAFTYVAPRLATAMQATEHHKGQGVSYVGRSPSASVATGHKSQHYAEITKFLDEAFDSAPRPSRIVVS